MDMIYRPIGKTGMSASIIGLGAEHVDFKPYETVETVIHTALDHGVNIIDCFMPGEAVRQHIGKAIEGRRDKVLIQGHICSSDINQAYDISRDLPTVKKYFENLLKGLKTDYIDFGMLFFIDSENDYSAVFETEILEYAQDLKKKGIVRSLGASSHNPVTARRVVETGLIDILLFSVNPAFDMVPASTNVLEYMSGESMKFSFEIDPDRAALYKVCEQRGVAITTMKTLGAGKLVSAEHSPFDGPLSVNQCIHYALTRPAVVSVLLGCSTREEMLASLSYLDASEEDKDFSRVIRGYQGKFKGNCVYCSHCQPCQAGINIAEVIKYLDISTVSGESVPPPSALSHYKSLEKHASDCLFCADCENRCPFSVPIMEKMKKAAGFFEL